MRVWLVIFLAALAPGLRGDSVDDYARAQLAKHQIPGLALTIIRTGQPDRTSAYGFANLELKSPARPETVFEIGSLTKQFTAAGLLLLQQDGKLSVDDRLSKHIALTPPAWSNITLHHLLNHTSGLRNYTGLDGFEMSKHLTQAQFVQALAAQPMDFATGEKWKYCNSGYNLLGFVLENLSGENYWAFLAERIFGPLGMATATNRNPAWLVPNRASGYLHKRGEIFNRDGDLTDVFAAGAIVATVGDLAKWNASLDQGKLLNEASRALMWMSGKLNDGSDCHYGFGWRVDPYQGHKNIGHSGSTSGFSASLQRFPDDGVTVIVLCNSDEPNIATTIARGLAEIFFKKTPAKKSDR